MPGPPVSLNLLSRFLRQSHRQLAYAEGEFQQIYGLLLAVGNELGDKIREVDLTGGTINQRVRNQTTLFKQIESIVGKRFSAINKELASRLLVHAKHEQAWLTNEIADYLGTSAGMPVLRVEHLREIVSDQLIHGAPSAQWWAKQSDDLVFKFSQQVRLGMVSGETTPEIVLRIIGKPTGRRIAYRTQAGKLRYIVERTGGIMDTQYRQGKALVVSSVHTTNANVRRRIYAEHDFIEGVKQFSTLDTRTTPICRSYDQKAWKIVDGIYVPLGHNLPYDSGVPRHFQCRSAETPIFDGMVDPAYREPDGSLRASMRGPVPANLD